MQDDNLKHGPYFANAVFKGSKKLPQKQEKNGEPNQRMKHSDGHRQAGRPSSRSRTSDNQRTWMHNNRSAYPNNSYQQWSQQPGYSADVMPNFVDSPRNAPIDNPRSTRSSSNQRSQNKRSSRHTSSATAQYGPAGHNGQQPRQGYTSQQRHSNQYNYPSQPAPYEPYNVHYDKQSTQPPHWPSPYNPNGLQEPYANNTPQDYYGQPSGYNHGYNTANTFSRYKHGTDAGSRATFEPRQRSTSRPPSNSTHYSSDEQSNRSDVRPPSRSETANEPMIQRDDELSVAPTTVTDCDAGQNWQDTQSVVDSVDKRPNCGDQSHLSRRRPTLEPYERPDDKSDERADDESDTETIEKTDSNSADETQMTHESTPSQPEMQQSSQNIVHEAQKPRNIDTCDLDAEADKRISDFTAMAEESRSVTSDVDSSNVDQFAKELESTPNGMEDISSDADEYFECTEYTVDDAAVTASIAAGECDYNS